VNQLNDDNSSQTNALNNQFVETTGSNFAGGGITNQNGLQNFNYLAPELSIEPEVASAKSIGQTDLEGLLNILAAHISQLQNISMYSASNQSVQDSTESMVFIKESLGNISSQLSVLSDVQRGVFIERIQELIQQNNDLEYRMADLVLINKAQQGILVNTEETMNIMKVDYDVSRSALKTQI
jgi:hypothetical protein